MNLPKINNLFQKSKINNFFKIKNQNRNNKKQDAIKQEIVNVFNPNSLGESKWIDIDYIKNHTNLRWTNNGNQRNGSFFGDKKYKWEKIGVHKTTSIRTIGFNDNELNKLNRPISKKIRNYYKNKPCVSCGSHTSIVIDHKNDLYNDKRVLNSKTQNINDFQPLCNHCNLVKKSVSKKVRETGKRIGATTIPALAPHGVDFIEGDENFDINDIYAMKGTYWYDPIAFNNYLFNKNK